MRATIGVAIPSLPLFSYAVGYNETHDDDTGQVDDQIGAHRNILSLSKTSVVLAWLVQPRLDMILKSCANG